MTARSNTLSHTARLVAAASAVATTRPLTICHFTVAHTQLKSRSFHRELLPLAAAGVNIRYIAPMDSCAPRNGVHFVPLPRRRSRLARVLTAIGLLRLLLRQEASLYFFQDPELLPTAFALKLLFRKRVVYDAYRISPLS